MPDFTEWTKSRPDIDRNTPDGVLIDYLDPQGNVVAGGRAVNSGTHESPAWVIYAPDGNQLFTTPLFWRLHGGSS